MAAITPDSVVPGTRLLVVEDEPAIQDMLAMSLAFVGYDVVRASTGAEAVVQAGKARIDLALLLFESPAERDWQEALNILRGVELRRDDWEELRKRIPPDYQKFFYAGRVR